MAPAKLTTFAALGELQSCNVQVVPWRVLQDGTVLKAPRYNDAALLLDLTPGEDDWLKASAVAGFDYVANLKKHHNASETVACRLPLELPSELAADVKRLDQLIMHKAMERSDMLNRDSGLNWLPMLRTETQIMTSIVLQGSDAMTQLCFVSEDGSVQQGEGLEFFKAQLGDCKIEDFSLKVRAEMQFIDVQNDMHRKTVAVKAHSMALVRSPKEEVASFTQDDISSFVRAAKRIRINRL